MNLLDALSSNTRARSVVELSLSSLFCREYSSLYKAIQGFFVPETSQAAEAQPQAQPTEVQQPATAVEKQPKPATFEEQSQAQRKQLLTTIAPVVPPPEKRSFHLLGLDVTPVPRPYAKTLADRGFVYQPNQIRGNKPITIGHPYSILAELPEKVAPYDAPWTIPLIAQRVGIDQTAREVGTEQINQIST